MIEQRLELRVLQPPQELGDRICRALPHDGLAGIDHGQGIQRTGEHEPSSHRSGRVSSREFNHAAAHASVDRVVPDPAVPIACVPEIRLTPMNNGVDHGPLRIGHVLDEVVGLVVVVVIEEASGNHPVGGLRAERQLPAQAPQTHFELPVWEHARPRSLLKVRQFRRAQKGPNSCDTLGRGGTSHRENVWHLPTAIGRRQIQAELRPCRPPLLS